MSNRYLIKVGIGDMLRAKAEEYVKQMAEGITNGFFNPDNKVWCVPVGGRDFEIVLVP